MTRWLAALPLVALVGFAGLGLVQLFDGSKPGFERVSREAPARSFPTLDGATVAFDRIGGDAPVVVNLWATWCTPCLAEHPLLMDLARRYPDRVHGLLYRDSPDKARAYLDRHGNPFSRIGLDPSGQGALDFGLTGVPETFVIAPGGEIILHLRGQLSEASIAALEDALTRQSPRR